MRACAAQIVSVFSRGASFVRHSMAAGKFITESAEYDDSLFGQELRSDMLKEHPERAGIFGKEHRKAEVWSLL